MVSALRTHRLINNWISVDLSNYMFVITFYLRLPHSLEFSWVDLDELYV